MNAQQEGPKPRRWGFPLVLIWIAGTVILSLLEGLFLPWLISGYAGPRERDTLVFQFKFFNLPFYGAAWGSLVLIAYIWLTQLSTLAKVCYTLIVLAIAAVVVTCLFWWWALGHMAP